jgi:hypothetical protein
MSNKKNITKIKPLSSTQTPKVLDVPKEIRRVPIAVRVTNDFYGMPIAYITYDVLMTDCSVKREYGRTLRTTQTIGAQTNDQAIRPDLLTTLKAARILLDDIEHACLTIDGQEITNG